MMRRAVSLISLILAGCAVGPDYVRPETPKIESYGGEQNFARGQELQRDWWTLFHSAKLNGWVEKALAGNPSLEAAKASLRQSRELYSAQWTALLPTLQGSFAASRNSNSDKNVANASSATSAYFNLYTAQLSLGYLPDIWGGTRRQIEGAEAQVENSRFQWIAADIALSSNVVVTAILEAQLQAQAEATRRILAIQHDLTEKTRQQVKLGTASQLDLLSQQAAEAATAQSLAPLEKQRAQAHDALAALMGLPPQAWQEQPIALDELSLPAQLPLSLPAKLVEQRPDVRQAEANVQAASAAVGVAVAAFLPQIPLTATIGSNGLHAGDLFQPGHGLWEIGGQATQTIFDSGALLHKRRAADAALEVAQAQYRAAVIGAFQNVTDCLRALQSDADSLAAANEAAKSADLALALAIKQRNLGSISQTALLAAEQAALQARMTLVQAQANRYSDSAALFLALGGGWWTANLEAWDERAGSTPR
jgi:NodT family efflux transporter outer membrane factor (OMF) lipoprotein